MHPCAGLRMQAFGFIDFGRVVSGTCVSSRPQTAAPLTACVLRSHSAVTEWLVDASGSSAKRRSDTSAAAGRCVPGDSQHQVAAEAIHTEDSLLLRCAPALGCPACAMLLNLTAPMLAGRASGKGIVRESGHHLCCVPAYLCAVASSRPVPQVLCIPLRARIADRT